MAAGGRQKRELRVCSPGHQGNIRPTLGKSDSGQKPERGIYGSHVENFSTRQRLAFSLPTASTVHDTLLTSAVFRLLGQENFRVPAAILGSGYSVTGP